MRFILAFLCAFSVAALLAQTRQEIQLGTSANDGTGDSLRGAFIKVSNNESNLFKLVLTNSSILDASFVVEDVAALVALDPEKKANVRTLGYYAPGDGGGATYRWTNALPSGVATNRLTWFAGASGYWARMAPSVADSVPTEGVSERLYPFKPTPTLARVMDASTTTNIWNANPSLKWFDGMWHAVWDYNGTGGEADPGQRVMWATSEDFSSWTIKGDAFFGANSTNPVSFDAATDYAFQPSLAVINNELWCWWHSAGATWSTNVGSRQMFVSKLSSSAGTWTNTTVNVPLSINGVDYYGFPASDPIALPSGRVLLPLTWSAVGLYETVSGYSGTTFRTQAKQNGVLYSDDSGVTWNIGGMTQLPNDSSAMWEPFVVLGNNGSLRMFSRNLHPLTYSNSGLLVSAVGSSGGERFSQSVPSGIDAIDSRMSVIPAIGNRRVMVGSDNVSTGSQFVDRQNISVFVSNTGSDDFVPGASFTGWDIPSILSYPQGDQKDGEFFILFSVGSEGKRSMWSAKMDAPESGKYYIHARRNNEYYASLKHVSASPSHFIARINTRIAAVTNSSTWGSVSNVSLSSWVWSDAIDETAQQVWFDNRGTDTGLFLARLSDKTLRVYYNDSLSNPVNLDYSLTMPTNEWVYTFVTVGPTSSTAWVVTSDGAASSATVAVTNAPNWAGSTVYAGKSKPGSLAGSWVGKIRSVRVWANVSGSEDNARYAHALDASALGVTAWAGSSSALGAPEYELSADDPDAGLNNAGWLARFEETSTAEVGYVGEEVFESRQTLVITGSGSASVEIPKAYTSASDTVMVEMDMHIPALTSGESVFAVVGSKTNAIKLISRSSGVVEMLETANGKYTTLGTVQTNAWHPLSIRIGGNNAWLSLGPAGGYGAVYYDKQPRIFIGDGYGSTVSDDHVLHVDTETAWVSVRKSGDLPTSPAVNTRFPSLTVANTTPSLELHRTGDETSVFLDSSSSGVQLYSDSSVVPFTFDTSNGRVDISAGSSVQPNLQIKGYNGQPYIQLQASKGTREAPTAITSGSGLASLYAAGHDGSSWVGAKAELRMIADATWTPSSTPTRIAVLVTDAGTTSRRTKLEFDADSSIDWTDSQPDLRVTAGNGASGLNVSVFGTSTNVFSVLNGGAKVFQVTTNGVNVTGVASIQPTTTTLTESGGDVTITGGKRAAYSHVLNAATGGDANLVFSGLVDGDTGTIYVHPAATNVTITLSDAFAFSPTGSTLTVNGGTGSTNHTIIAWENKVVGSPATNRVSVNASNYYR